MLHGSGQPQTETVEVWCRDPVECIREIIGNPSLKDHMHYSPFKIFTIESYDEKIFNKMCTAEWWWDLQVSHAMP